MTKPQPTASNSTYTFTSGQILTFAATIVTAIVAIVSYGISFGKQTAESVASEKFAKLQTEITIQTDHAQQANDKLRQYVEYIGTLKSQIAQRDAQIIFLNERLGRTNTCGYLQQQISSLEQQMSNITSGKRIRGTIQIFGGGEDEQRRRDEKQKQQDDADLAQLQQRVIAYSQQLSACAK